MTISMMPHNGGQWLLLAHVLFVDLFVSRGLDDAVIQLGRCGGMVAPSVDMCST